MSARFTARAIRPAAPGAAAMAPEWDRKRSSSSPPWRVSSGRARALVRREARERRVLLGEVGPFEHVVQPGHARRLGGTLAATRRTWSM